MGEYSGRREERKVEVRGTEMKQRGWEGGAEESGEMERRKMAEAR